MAERPYWRDIRASIGIWFKACGCRLVHGKDPVTGKTRHPWGPWRTWPDSIGAGQIRACRSCGTYDHRTRQRRR